MCVCIGSRLGVLFSEFEPLKAYSINVAGAITGRVFFQMLSTFGFAPWQMALLPILVVVVDLIQRGNSLKPSYIAPFVLIPLIFLLVPSQHNKPLIAPFLNALQTKETTTLWSPYQRIDLAIFNNSQDKASTRKSLLGLELSANRAFYQYFFNSSPAR